MTRLSLKIALLASVMALPLTALAQAQPAAKDSGGFDVSDAPAAAPEAAPQYPPTTSGEIAIGVGYVSDTSDVFGRYNGRPEKGVGEIGGWNYQHRDAWDSGKTHYLSFTGDNVDFGFGRNAPEAAINLKLGSQGHWWASAGYSAETYTASDHFTTIINRDGSLSAGYLAAITAAGAFVSNSATPNIPGAALVPPLTTAAPGTASAPFYGTTYNPNGTTGIASSAGNHVNQFGPSNEISLLVGTRRDKGSFGAGLQTGNWTLTAGLVHEHKAGSLEQAMTTGGNNGGMMTFAQPVDYDTDIYTVSAAYNTRKFQAAFSYELSNFADNNATGFHARGWNFNNVKDPTTNTYTAYQSNAVYALPPSNQAHTFTGQLAYNATPTTRVNATLVYSAQFQDDPFPDPTGNAYTLNIGGVATHNTKSAPPAPFGLNPASLKGFVETWFGSASLYSRPMDKVDFRASYSVDVRDPHQAAMWIFGDPTDALQNGVKNAAGAYASIKYREAVPESWTKQKMTVSAGYHLARETTLTATYTFRDDRRGNAITHHAQDNEESVKLQTALLNDSVTGSINYTHSDRNASAPDWSLWLVQIVSDCGSTLALLGCQQVPFYEAARTQDAVTGMFTAAFNPKATLSLYAKYADNKYKLPAATYNGAVNPGVGINSDRSINIAPDLSYKPNEDNEFHAFYTYLQTHRAMNALNNQSVVGGGNYYTVDTTYEIHTAGVSASHRISPKLKVGADYIYSYGNIAFNQSGTWDNNEVGQTFGGDPLLSLKSDQHQVKLHASYVASKRLSLYVSYRYNSLDTTDYALVGASAGQVLTGDVPAKYNVHTIMGAAIYKF